MMAPFTHSETYRLFYSTSVIHNILTIGNGHIVLIEQSKRYKTTRTWKWATRIVFVLHVTCWRQTLTSNVCCCSLHSTEWGQIFTWL